MLPQRRWRLRLPRGETPGADGREHQPQDASLPGFPLLIQQLLVNRGITSQAEARRFLDGTAEYDPMALPDAEIAVRRLRQALRDGELIAIFGDFDVDGITGTAILSDGLRCLGGRVIPYIPDRFREGYGLNTQAIQRLHDLGAGVLVTMDCGTSNVTEIAAARSLGLDVIVVDHHTVPSQRVDAAALINPKRPDSRYPFSELSTGGLAYKLLMALSEACGRSEVADSYLDLAALSTVCDMIPLVEENRAIVRRGLAQLQQSRRPGLVALCRAAGIELGRISTDTISFIIGPRLNAAGRIAHGRTSLDLLLTEDSGEAERLAATLNALNQQRQQQTEAALKLAEDLLAADDATTPLIMIGDAQIPAGIVGLVASRLAEQYYRPAIVYEEGPQQSRGSCRSIPEFDIVAALRSCDELFQKYGGHRQAAGFTAATAHLPAIKQRLREQAAAALTHVELIPVIEVDAAVPLRALRGEEIRWLGRFAPCGIGNPEPVFMSSGVTLLDCRPVGDGGKHLRMKVRDGPIVWPAIAFRQEMGDLAPGSPIDLVYTVTPDRGGGDSLQLQVRDFRPSAVVKQTPIP